MEKLASWGHSPAKVIVKRCVVSVMKTLVLPVFQRVFNNSITVILYHDIDADCFKEHVQYLSKRYNFISLRQYADYISDKSLTLPKNSLIFTIDDGWRDNYKLLAEIKRNSVPVTIFLCAKLIGTNRKIWNYSLDRLGKDQALNTRLKNTPADLKNQQLMDHNGHCPTREYDARSLLSLTEIREMAPYVDFQSHGLFHEVLPMCDDEMLHNEIVESARELPQITGGDIYAFAFPYGRRDERCLDKVRQSGYSIARTSNIPSLNSMGKYSFELKSIGIGDNATVSQLQQIEAWAKTRYLLEAFINKFLRFQAKKNTA